MIHKAHHLLSFFPRRLRPEIKELYLSSIILNFGLALIFIFEPIYLFNLGYSLQQIMLFWVIIYFLYVLVLPLGGKISEKFGYEHTIFLGTAFWILLYLSMYLIEQHRFLFYHAFDLCFAKFTYWPAYHANFAKYSNDAERGREVGGLTILTSLTYVIGPAIGGLILQQWGFHILFIVVAAVLLLSNIPMLLTKEVFRSDP
jgi:MFS family permease